MELAGRFSEAERRAIEAAAGDAEGRTSGEIVPYVVGACDDYHEAIWKAAVLGLLAGGGVLYFAFPAVYARSFSGFYLPLMMVLWLLIGRAVALELRNHLDQPLWKTFFDKMFGICSLLLAIFFIAASPHAGQSTSGVSLSFWMTSVCWPHDWHWYS